MKKIRWVRLAWSIFVVLYLGLFFWNFFIKFPDRLISTLYLYILILWLSIEYYLRQSFFQSGRLITEDAKNEERYDHMNLLLKSLFAIFFYSCIGLAIGDFVWWKKGQVTILKPFLNIAGIIILLIGVIIRIKVDLLMFQKPQSIIRRGLYNRIRHPAYFATLLIIFSIACAFSSLLALGYVLAVGLPLIYLEARFEDLFLARINGSDYEAYKKETRLFIPNIL